MNQSPEPLRGVSGLAAALTGAGDGVEAFVSQVREIARAMPGVRDAWLCFQELGQTLELDRELLCRLCRDWYAEVGLGVCADHHHPVSEPDFDGPAGCCLLGTPDLRLFPLRSGPVVHGYLLVALQRGALGDALECGLENLARLSAAFVIQHWSQPLPPARSDWLHSALPLIQKVIEAVADGVFLKDAAGRYLCANRAFATLCKHPAERLVGHQDAALFAPDLATILGAGDASVMSGAVRYHQGEHRMVLDRGGILRLDVAKSAVCDPDGAVLGVIGIVRDVTEWYRREDAERMLWRAVEQSPSSILITDANGLIQYVNPGFERASGYSAVEAYGQNPRILKSGQSQFEVYRELWQTIKNGSVWHGEFHNRRRDGSYYWVTASISPVRDARGITTHYIAVEEDITRIKDLQEKLRRSEERYRGASEASLDGLFILDAVRDQQGVIIDFRVEGCNPAGCALLGVTPDQMTGRPLEQAVSFAAGLGLRERYRQVVDNGTVLDEQIEITQGSLQGRWLHQMVVPLADGIAITCRDITALKNYEGALKAARAAAEEANAAKSVFLATMSHELRTPLNAILGFSELIRDEAFGPVGTERYADYAADIHSSGQHLLELITAILDISKIEAGKLELDFHPFDARGLLAQCLTQLMPQALQHDLTLTGDWPADLPLVVADERAVRQIVLNLLSNAVKFTPQGGRVLLSARLVGSMFEIAVSDTGIGIPADHINRVLRPFEQLDNSYSRGAGGTGLGLALVKALAELHGGTVCITSRVRQGTTVTIRLPQDVQPAALPRPKLLRP